MLKINKKKNYNLTFALLLINVLKIIKLFSLQTIIIIDFQTVPF